MKIHATPGSQLDKLRRLRLKPREPFVPFIDRGEGNILPNNRPDSLGAGIRPIEQPTKRKSGPKPKEQNRRYKRRFYGGNWPERDIVCKWSKCGKTTKGRNPRQQYCGQPCKMGATVDRKREARHNED